MECSNSTPSEAEMTRCLKAKALKSQKELQNTEKKMIKILSEWDEDPSNINIAKANLTTANKEFIKYRDAQCKFNYSLGGGAIENALEMRLFACIAELNNRRNQQLIDLMSDILPK
nr:MULTISPECIES: lysozyme inhibitor LprI family protein [unclassified Snodgrassella]